MLALMKMLRDIGVPMAGIFESAHLLLTKASEVCVCTLSILFSKFVLLSSFTGLLSV